MKSTILTEEAMLASMPLAMQGTCNSLNLLSSFSDGLLARRLPRCPCCQLSSRAAASIVSAALLMTQ